MNLYYSYKDLFKAPRIAFSFQRIWANWIGLFLAYAVYVIVTYLSIVVSGLSLGDAWHRFRLAPCGYLVSLPWYGLVIFWIGVAAALAIYFLTNTAVARLSYMTLREELFYSWKQGYKFAYKKWASVLGSYITFIFMIALFVIGALVMGFIGRIPYVGEIGTFLLTVPYWLAGLLLVFIGMVFFAALYMVPAIIATSHEDALGGVFQTFSMLYNQPFRWIWYVVLLGIISFIGTVLFGAFLKLGLLVFGYLFSIGMGDKFTAIFQHGLHNVQAAWAPMFSAVTGWYQYPEWLSMFFSTSLPALSVSGQIAAGILTVFLLFIFCLPVAFMEAIGNAGLAIIYVVLYKLHEGENLLEREDEELKEEEEEEEKSDTSDADEEKPDAEKDDNKDTESSGEGESESKEE